MNTFLNMISQEYETLQKQIKYIKDHLAAYPAGRMEVSYKNGYAQYYFVGDQKPDTVNSQNNNRGTLSNNDDQQLTIGNQMSDTNRKRKYIKAGDRNLAKQISQRDYERKLLRQLEMRERALVEVISAYENTSPEDTLLNFSKGRRDLIKPLLLPDELFIEEWQSEKYEGRPFENGAPEILTVKGERVRSKSEKIIADTLERYKIPYKYECPLSLSSGITVYPDFRVLNVQDRKEMIWEHFGMMNNENYASNTTLKINSYMNNGYYPGDQLIISMESTQTSLSTKLIELIIKKYLVSDL